jgi:2-amino-4-hydroxy-6-hydroxymethyldihydropteridine diphosphokinase
VVVKTFIALGSNLGDPVKRVNVAIREIDDLPETKLLKASSLYQTAPEGLLEQPDFINAVIEIETALSAEILLLQLLAIEQRAGRIRNVKNGPRTLDLDILLYGQEVINKVFLQIPHPRLTERAFVLVPLIEIAPILTLPCQTLVSNYLQKLVHVDGKIVKIQGECT